MWLRFFLRLNIGRGRAINSFEVHGLVDVRRQAQGSHPETELPEPLAVHESTPSPPCGRKRGRERWVGRTRGKRRGRCSGPPRSACRRRRRPAEENEVGSGGEGGRGADFEDNSISTEGTAVPI